MAIQGYKGDSYRGANWKRLAQAQPARETVVWTANATGTAEPTVFVAFVKRAQMATTATVRYAQARLCVRMPVWLCACDSLRRRHRRRHRTITLQVTFAQLGLAAKSCTIRDLWAQKDVTSSAAAGAVSWVQSGGPGYDGGLFSLTKCS